MYQHTNHASNHRAKVAMAVNRYSAFELNSRIYEREKSNLTSANTNADFFQACAMLAFLNGAVYIGERPDPQKAFAYFEEAREELGKYFPVLGAGFVTGQNDRQRNFGARPSSPLLESQLDHYERQLAIVAKAIGYNSKIDDVLSEPLVPVEPASDLEFAIAARATNKI